MNIKNKLYISAIISVIVVVILFSLVLMSSDRIARVSKQLELADDVYLAVSELDIVTYEYLLHREKRMEQQWNSRYDSMGEILEKAEGVGEVEMMKSIRADYAALGDLFSQVTANYEERQKLIQEGASQEKIDANILLEERLVAQLLIKSQSIITDASRLAEEAHAESREAQELSSTLTLTLMIILAVTITTTSLVVVRSISKPLDELTKGAEIIGKGNLGHLIESKTKDEVGELATAFNRMTTNLKEITASRDELNKEVAERKQAEEKAARLNAILGAIRNVNQLIVREKDRDRLIQGMCENLIETRGYYSAWIALVDENRRFLTAAEAGLGERFAPLVEMMKRGEFTRCEQNTLEQNGIVMVEDVTADCADCPLVGTYAGRAGMAVRLEYRDRIYGILSVSIPAGMAADAGEQSLFNEVAGDIALALRDMELEEGRKRAEEALRELNLELEEQVKKRTAELTKANEELKQDIIERKRAEEKLRLFSQAADSSPDGVAMGNFEGRITYVNETFVRMFGYSKEELIGKEIAFIYPKDQIPKLEEALKATTEGGWTGELVGKRKNGELFPMAISSAVVLDEEGRVIAHMASHRDITERKQAEDKIKEAYRLREHFLKETSHRIITPVAIIGGNTDLLLESSNLDDDQKEKIRIIRERNEEVQKLVRDALAGKYLEEEGSEG